MSPYKVTKRKGTRMTLAVHTLLAEQAIGRHLPNGAQVHHIDGNRYNNDTNNLVICPNRAYHALLHRRTRALKHGGNADWLRCRICKKWDEPSNLNTLIINDPRGKYLAAWHRACDTEYKRNKRLLESGAIYAVG